MKRNLGKGKAKGTVLFTVVTVMLVMVVLLMTTLTLTSAASRRSYYTYFESQAQYAAQAAIDAITYGAYQDDAFHDFVVAAPHESDVSDTNPAPEIQIRFDGSTIPFTNGDNVVRCTIERLDPDAKWDDATSALHTRDMWRITATAHVGTGRNEATYSISEYLYENFQVAAEDLVTAPTNRGNYLLTRYITTPGSEDDVVVAPLGSSPGLVMFGNQGFANNMIQLGPSYNNLVTLPRGWGKYGNVNYDTNSYGNSKGENRTADPYDIMITNDKMKSVGDAVFVNNVYDRVKWNIDFQSPNEGVVIYGNLGIYNEGLWLHSNVNAFDYSADGRLYYEDNCNYLYVDGRIESDPNGGSSYVMLGKDGTNPVNLYCGSMIMDKTNYRTDITGDVYMYDPTANSVWIRGDGYTPLSEFVGMEIYKEEGKAANSVGGNIICNNLSFQLGDETRDFDVPGDIIMVNPKSSLTISSKVHVHGKVISAGTVTNNGTVDGGVVQGRAAMTGSRIETEPDDYVRNGYANGGYDDSYKAAQSPNEFSDPPVYGDYDFRLMPFEHRIDEIFERYYRWDLQSDDVSAMDTAIDHDDLILESRAAGHEWLYDTFDTPSGLVYVPYTEPVLENRFVIKKHQYFNPAEAIGQMVDNHMANITDYGSFVGAEGLPKFGTDTPERLKDVTLVSHDASGVIHEDTIPGNEQLYVIRESCEIDLADYADAAGFFIDPSNLTGMNILKIALKGTTNRNAKPFYFIVNNTADYAGDDYSHPTPYCEYTPIKSAGRTQVQVFLEESFGGESASPFFMTSGAWRQMNPNDGDSTVSVVRSPMFPSEDNDLSGLDDDVRYAYELVPNFTMFGQADATYDFNNTSGNGVKFNADVAMPCSSFRFGTLNSGTYNVTYRETPTSEPSTGESYLWSISSLMLENLYMNDPYAVNAYVGGMGITTGGPGITTAVSDGSGGSARLGENRNPWFNNEHIGN